MPLTVKVSSKNVLVKDDRIVLMRRPADLVKRTASRFWGVWKKEFLERERRAWRR